MLKYIIIPKQDCETIFWNSLTKTEYQLLFCLMSHKNEALSRERIMDMVWGLQHYIDPNSVDVYVRYLRNKLDVVGKESCITTLRGIGYIMKESSWNEKSPCQ